MSPPANNASSFGLAHDLPRRRSTRSPSPKVSFPSSPKAALSSQGNGIKNIRRQVIRRLSNLQPNGGTHVEVFEVNGHDIMQDQDEDDSHDQLSNGHAMNGHPSTSVPKEKSTVQKVDWEIPRKLLHSSIGFFTIYLYTSQGSPRTVVLVLSTALAIIVSADILRFRYPSFERLYERCLGFLMRESEKNAVNGVVWYILGVNFALSVYPLDIATVSILVLSWADTAASTIGRLFGSRTPPLPERVPLLPLRFSRRKSLAGFIAASITGACAAIGFWGYIGPVRPTDLSWRWDIGVGTQSAVASGWLGLGTVGIVAGLISGVAEALDLGSLDDNLTLPIIAGGCLFGFFKLLNLFSS